MSEEKKYEHINLDFVDEGNYAIVSINRPDKLNALQNQTLEEIAEALKKIEVDPRARCVVLRGTKDYTKKPAFSAGADLSERGFPDLDRDNLRHQSHAMYRRPTSNGTCEP